jgi:hypothetical protein
MKRTNIMVFFIIMISTLYIGCQYQKHNKENKSAILAVGNVRQCYQCHDVAKEYDDLWILRDQNYLKNQ